MGTSSSVKGSFSFIMSAFTAASVNSSRYQYVFWFGCIPILRIFKPITSFALRIVLSEYPAAPTFQPMGKAVDAIRLARGAVKRAFDLFHALFFLPGIQAHKSRIHADFGMVVLACADFLC